MPTDDYIKRSELIEHFNNFDPGYGLIDQREVVDGIRDFPAADVVPAPVRCSDCRFYDKRDGGAPGGTGWCSRPGAGCGVPEEFFCAGAERKEEERQ